ncbi:MAG: mediator complex subunit [Peltula sp. TS41687]|nr:MAG: mediator complex subunit [Peltula sp. TS41687]
MGSNVQEWSKFLSRCLHNRLPVGTFEGYAKLLHDRSPVTGHQLADLFLTPNTSKVTSFDPLLPLYIETLVGCDLIKPSNLLDGLYRVSKLQDSRGPSSGSTSDGDHEHLQRGHSPHEMEELLIVDITRMYSTGQQPKSLSEVFQVLRAVCVWMSGIVQTSARDDMMQHDVNAEVVHLSMESLMICALAVAILGNPRVSGLLSGTYPKDIKKALTHSLSLFIPVLSRISIQNASQLEAFQRQYGLYEGTTGKEIDKIMDGVGAGTLHLDGLADFGDLDGQVINSRAGPYILLNALLVARPAIDDTLLLNHLYSRYKGNISTLTTDLIVASFDVLSNAAFRNEHRQTLFLLRSFLINKVPLLLTELATSMFPPLTPEFCVAQALTHVDPQAFPSFSSMFDVSTDGGILSEVRLEFLFACCLHDLIPEASIEPLLGEPPMQELPPGGKYSKDLLVNQCMNDPGRIEALLGEIESMDGNVGAVVEAVAEVTRNMCAAKETVPLKSICTSLAQKPSSLDVILLFVTPAALLQPISELLDGWRYEEDQGEYQPVYEEFGCILLLVLAFVYRYDLTPLDLGVSRSESFISQLLERGHRSQTLDKLSEERNKQLGGWIHGLFAADNGISDELMSSCRPQDFYMLVPTLFDQSILACHANFMSLETLKGGLEYMLETFLLPSLVGAITWLTHKMWKTQYPGSDVLMQVLQSLIKPRSISGEAATVHQVLLSIIGSGLDTALSELRRREPSRGDIDPLVHVLKPHLSFKRTTASHHRELESWVPSHVDGLSGSLRNTFQSLVLWSTAPDINMTPASYTHRQIIVATQILGARTVVRTLLDELKLQSQNGSGGLALDIATALVCAPAIDDIPITITITTTEPSSSSSSSGGPDQQHQQQQHQIHRPNPRLTLREALKLDHDETAPTLSASDPVRAETIVRLHRRVEAHFAGIAAAAAAAAATTNIDVSAVAREVGAQAAGVSAMMMQEIDVAAAAVGMDVVGSMDMGGFPSLSSAAGGIAGVVDVDGAMGDVLLGKAAIGLLGDDDDDDGMGDLIKTDLDF